MNEYNIERVLSGIEDELAREAPDIPRPMAGDPWILASVMQKAIRRNEPERAAQAVAGLWRQDRQRLWMRLHIIALEDIGAGDPDVVVKMLAAFVSAPWRRRVGDERVAVSLSRVLCGAVKNRMTDEIFSIAQHDAAYAPLRERFAKADDGLLADYAADADAPLVERALALWMLFGTKRFPSDALPERIGCPDKAVDVLRGLSAPADLVEACIGVMNRTKWPLSVFLPPIWQEVRKQQASLHVEHDAVPPSPDVDDVPVYAADMFTRVGQASFRKLQKAVPELQAFSVRQIGLGVFYLDGGRVDKRQTSEALKQYQQRGEIADMESAGLAVPDYLSLRECLRGNMDRLNTIRHDCLQRHLEGAA